MPNVCYVERNFSEKSLDIIAQANEIITEYAAQGFDLTLRQLYYQFVSRDLIANRQREYKRLGSVINDARLAGLIDWDTIVDRTRNLEQQPSWESPSDIVESCSRQFRFDKWEGQEYRPEVWIEKDALIGVIEGVCRELQVPYFSCRGYTSQSEMWSAAQRLIRHANNDQQPHIFHLGDHDPSGIDMSRDIRDRLRLFMEGHDVQVTDFRRLALNMDQVREHDPPPNPTKITDSRADGYLREYGDESWELDALEPMAMAALIREAVEGIRDDNLWDERCEEEQVARETLRFAADNWDRVAQLDTESDE